MINLKPSIKKRLLVALGVIFLVAWSSLPSYAYDYQPAEIAPLAGYERSRALGINNAGEVVGRFYNVNADTGEAVDRQAFIWDQTRGARLLSTLSGESSAWGINNHGMVSGYAYTSDGSQHAALWDTSDNSIVDIGTLTNTTSGASGPTSTAYDLNDLGQVAGNADIPSDAGSFTPFHAFLYDQISGIQDLGTFTTAYPEWQNGYSIAYCVNNNGEAVGIAHDGSWTFLPFIYNGVNGMKELTRDPAYTDPDDEWYAVAINDNGLIGGHVIAAVNQSLPFYWPDKSSAPIRITMPAGFPYGEIYGINASGQMVGIMWDSDQEGATEHAFIFDVNQGVRDLNSLIDPASGWVLTFARDINDSSQIVGYGEKNGLKRGFVLKPSALTTHGDELAVDLGNLGIWHYNAGGWSRLSEASSEFMLNFSGSLLCDFGSLGVWQYSGTGWRQFSLADPDNDGNPMIAYGNGVIIDFGASGLWFTEDGIAWDKLSSVSPQFMATYGNYAVFDFGSLGVWQYSETGWKQFSLADPDNDGNPMIAYGNGVIIDFGASGLWFTEDGIAWDKLSDVSPQFMATYGNYAVFDFGGLGLWRFEATSPTPTWIQLSGADPDNNGNAVMAFGNGIVVDFGSAGLWFTVDGIAWEKLSDAGSQFMGTYGDVAVFDFGTLGLWECDGPSAAGSWKKLSDVNPDNMGNAFTDVNLIN